MSQISMLNGGESPGTSNRIVHPDIDDRRIDATALRSFEVGVVQGSGSWCHDRNTVVTDTSTWPSLLLDGQALPSPDPVAGSALGHAYVASSDGHHELLVPEALPVETMVCGHSYDDS